MQGRKSRHKHRLRVQKGRNIVNVTQSAGARTGQGGNAFAINASDVGVVRRMSGLDNGVILGTWRRPDFSDAPKKARLVPSLSSLFSRLDFYKIEIIFL